MKPLIGEGQSIELWVAAQIGTTAWEKLQTDTKTDIITAVACYQSFNEPKSPKDYSASILPIMKALEHELRTYFYDPYVAYLSQKYSPEEYADIILQDELKGDYEKAALLKKKVLIYCNGGLSYVNTEDENYFPLGPFIKTITTSSLKKGDRINRHLDKPIIDYCLEKLFPGSNASGNDIRKWLNIITNDVEAQIHRRNDSAHWGVIQNKLEADKAIRDVVIVGKLLSRIVHPSFLRTKP